MHLSRDVLSGVIISLGIRFIFGLLCSLHFGALIFFGCFFLFVGVFDF